MLSRSHIASMSPVSTNVSFSPSMGSCANTVVSSVFGQALEKMHATSLSANREEISTIWLSMTGLTNFRSLGAGRPGEHAASAAAIQ
jgi:hypothetical protein